MISVVAAEFHISPGEASEQDMLLVKQVMDYRLIQAGIDLINEGSKGMQTLSKNPSMQNALLEMHRAQAPEATMERMMEVLSEQAAKADEADEADELE